MIDKDYCMSSFLALRYVGKPQTDFSTNYKYRYPQRPDLRNRIIVNSAHDIDLAIKEQLASRGNRYKKIGLLLSGGMDSSILATYLQGADAYTFRFMGGTYQADELHRAEFFSEANNMKLHYVDISWDVVKDCVTEVMKAKGGPVHSIEPQIYLAAKQAQADGIDLMIIGDASDYVFGGMDLLLSRDWTFEDFVHRYIYVDPFEVLKNPREVKEVFEPYRIGNHIDFVKILEELAAQESYGSYDNAFLAAGLDYFDPYEKLKMKEHLDLNRVRNGESKYFIRNLFKVKYPGIAVPEKIPMPRPVEEYFASWAGPRRKEFKEDINIDKYNGNQKWLLWNLESFLNMSER